MAHMHEAVSFVIVVVVFASPPCYLIYSHQSAETAIENLFLFILIKRWRFFLFYH
jgi:hypothetical protein